MSMHTETHMNLEAAMDLADHASPAPWSASLALKAMRAEIQRLRRAQEKAQPVAKCVGVIEEIDEDTNSVLVGWYGPISCGDNLYTAPPAERVRVPDDAEAVSVCLGDDAADMLNANPDDERALNMQRAARIIDAMLSVATEADRG